MRIVFMGTPDFAITPLEFLMQNQSGVIAVYTQPDKAAGRGRRLETPPVKKVALKWGVSLYQPVSFKSTDEIEELKSTKPDVIVVAAFGQILPRGVLEIPHYGCLNIHPSLLPKYRGVSPVPAAIVNGDQYTGVSIMVMDRGVDTGPVLIQAQTPIMEWDTTVTLTDKLSRIGAQLLIDVLPRWIQGKVVPQNQDNEKASYTRAIEKQSGEIDWRQSAITIWRRVRAYQPWPGSYTRWQGRQLKVIEAIHLEWKSDDVPGRVFPLAGEAAFGVTTGSGMLGILRVQMEGKRVMTSTEFLRGQRQLIGATLPVE